MRDAKVVLKVCKEYSYPKVLDCLNQGLELLGGLNKVIKSNHTVLIKPDLYCSTQPDEAKTTNPSIVSAVAELVSKIGAKCIIADSPNGDFTQSKLDRVYEKTKMLEVSNNGNAILNTNEEISIITNANGESGRDIYVIDAVNDADVIINIGKFRCDKNLGLVGCAQNLFGLVPGKVKELIKTRCYTLKSYYNYLIDLYEILENKIVINILDGIVACEANNDPRILNCLLLGDNPYAVDSVALKIINQNPEKDLMLNESKRRNNFDFNISVLGDQLESLVCSDFNYSEFLENVKPGSTHSFKRKYNATQKRPVISAKLCKGCNICVQNCPMKAIHMKNNEFGEYAKIDRAKCINCFKCVESCPYKVITTKTPIKYLAIGKRINKNLKNK